MVLAFALSILEVSLMVLEVSLMVLGFSVGSCSRRTLRMVGVSHGYSFRKHRVLEGTGGCNGPVRMAWVFSLRTLIEKGSLGDRSRRLAMDGSYRVGSRRSACSLNSSSSRLLRAWIASRKRSLFDRRSLRSKVVSIISSKSTCSLCGRAILCRVFGPLDGRPGFFGVVDVGCSTT